LSAVIDLSALIDIPLQDVNGLRASDIDCHRNAALLKGGDPVFWFGSFIKSNGFSIASPCATYQMPNA
jgi:hypothetical protein